MAEESLKIVLTADNKQAIAAMKETILAMHGVEKSAGNTGKGVKKLGTDFTGVSRVIQDLPFGFMAIQNNLTQLLPAAGAAGLALSALMAGIQFAQVGLTYWTRGVKEADEAMSASTKALTELNVQLQNSKNDFAAVRAGVLSKKEALDRYNDTLGKSVGYAKSIEEAEALMVKNTATVVQAMNLRTQAQLFQAKSAELTAKLTTGETYNLSLMEQAVVGLKASLGGLGNVMKVAGQEMSTRFTDANAQIKQFDKLSQEALTKAIGLEKGLAGSRTKPGGGGVTDKQINAYVKAQKELEYYNRLLVEQSAINRLRANMAGKDTATVSTGGINLPQQKDLNNLQLTINSNNTLNKVLAEQAMALNMVKLKKDEAFAADTANYLTQSITNMFNAMINGQSIGTALGDMFKRLAVDIAMASAKAAIFQGIMSVLTAPLSTGAKAGQAVAGAMGFAGGGGGKKGGGFLSLLGKLLGFSEGGTVSGPKSGYPVMLHGTEHIVRPDQMRSIIASASQMGGGNSRVVVEGRISGNDIFISQKRTSTFRALTT
jgi:hypothetical protein